MEENLDQMTINQCLKSKRTDNFSSSEKCIFIDLLVNKYKSLHEDRSHNKENNVLKRETWKALLKDFHIQVGNSRRTLTQIKTLYENIKHRIKKCVDKGVFEIDWEPVNESGTFKIPIQLFEKIRYLYEQKSNNSFQIFEVPAELEIMNDETGKDSANEELVATTLEDYPNFAILDCTKVDSHMNSVAVSPEPGSDPKVGDKTRSTIETPSDNLGQESDGPLSKKAKFEYLHHPLSLPKEFLSTTEEFRRLAKVRAAAAQAELKLELQQNRQRHIAELRVLDLKAKAQQAKIEYYNILKNRLLNESS